MPKRTGKRAAGPALAGAEQAELCAEILKAVAHPLRLRIVATLCEGAQNVNGLAELLGAPQSIVSQQLRILRMHDLVSAERREGFALYSLAEPHLRTLVECMGRCIAERCAAPGPRRRQR